MSDTSVSIFLKIYSLFEINSSDTKIYPDTIA